MSRTVRVAAVCGSRGATSANRHLLDAFVAIAGARVSVVATPDVAEVPHFDPDRVDDPPVEVARWRAALDAADAVVLAVPEYAASIPGTLKNALDWLVGSATLYGKPVLVLTAGTTGGEHVRPAMVLTLSFQGAVVVATFGVEGPRAKFGADGALTDAGTRAALDELVNALVGAVVGVAPPSTR